MPKDPTRNQPNYKIDGGHLNEYEYEQNKGSMTEEQTGMPRDSTAQRSNSGGENEKDDLPSHRAERNN
ncbi:MAG: hypothetical protein ACK4S4_09920 [Pyrinomonadaceae bacterium]